MSIEWAPAIMDFPTAWAFIREQHPDPDEHHPHCSWVQAAGGMLCDCDVLWDEYERRKAAVESAALSSPVVSPRTTGGAEWLTSSD